MKKRTVLDLLRRSYKHITDEFKYNNKCIHEVTVCKDCRNLLGAMDDAILDLEQEIASADI